LSTASQGLYKPPQNHPVKLPDLAPRPAWLRSPYPHLSFKALGDKHPSVVRDTWLSQVPTSSQPVAPTGKDLAGGRMVSWWEGVELSSEAQRLQC